jgi:hypothetical protein
VITMPETGEHDGVKRAITIGRNTHHALALVSDVGERGWLWCRAALLPVSSVLAVAFFEGSRHLERGAWEISVRRRRLPFS